MTETPRIRGEQVDKVLDDQMLLGLTRVVWQVPVSRHVVSYAVNLSRATRPQDTLATDFTRQYVEWGAGPRAGQYLVLAAKALAAIEGNPTPGCDHVREMAMAVLRHRVIMNYAAAGEGMTSRDLVEELVRRVPEPDYRGPGGEGSQA